MGIFGLIPFRTIIAADIISGAGAVAVDSFASTTDILGPTERRFETMKARHAPNWVFVSRQSERRVYEIMQNK